MKKLLILLLLFGFNNVYAESGTFSSSAVCEYDKSAINTNNKMVISLYFECISTCDTQDGVCISRCVEILKEYEN